MQVVLPALVGLALTVVAGTSSAAQSAPPPWNPDSIVCVDSAVAAASAYGRCALMYDRNVIRRGIDGAVVEKPGFLRPIRLERLVVGDSAKRYAASYERNGRRASILGIVGGALMLTSVTVADVQMNRDCSGPYGGCYTNDPGVAPAMMFVAGSASLLLTIPFQLRADRAAVRAVWWNNMRFGR